MATQCCIAQTLLYKGLSCACELRLTCPPPRAAQAVYEACDAAASGDLPALRRLLAADPGLAARVSTAYSQYCSTPLSRAAFSGQEAAARLLLEAAPGAALAADRSGMLPLHWAACGKSEAIVRLLLAAEPAAASAPDSSYARYPLHYAAEYGRVAAARLLADAAPAVAAVRARDPPEIPLYIALWGASNSLRLGFPAPEHIETARALLPATPAEEALSVLEQAGAELAPPLFPILAASQALSPGQWERVWDGSHLGAALPAVLARSEAEAGLLVRRLPAEERQRLRTAALCLERAQRRLGVELPGAVVGRVLALAAGPATPAPPPEQPVAAPELTLLAQPTAALELEQLVQQVAAAQAWIEQMSARMQAFSSQLAACRKCLGLD